MDAGVVTIRGVGCATFINQIGNSWANTKCINAGAMRGMEHFVTNWESGDQCKE